MGGQAKARTRRPHGALPDVGRRRLARNVRTRKRGRGGRRVGRDERGGRLGVLGLPWWGLLFPNGEGTRPAERRRGSTHQEGSLCVCAASPRERARVCDKERPRPSWGSRCCSRSASPPPSSSAESARSGSTRMRSTKSRWPTPVRSPPSLRACALRSALSAVGGGRADLPPVPPPAAARPRHRLSALPALCAPCAPAAGLLACGAPTARALVANPPSAVSLSGQNIRKLVKDGFVLAKPQKVHSRARTNAYAEAKRKGRHTGHGKRKGAKEGRMPVKVLWIRRMRVLRRLLKKYREQKKVRSMPTPGKGGGGGALGGERLGGGERVW